MWVGNDDVVVVVLSMAGELVAVSLPKEKVRGEVREIALVRLPLTNTL